MIVDNNILVWLLRICSGGPWCKLTLRAVLKTRLRIVSSLRNMSGLKCVWPAEARQQWIPPRISRGSTKLLPIIVVMFVVDKFRSFVFESVTFLLLQFSSAFF